jgi:hypothetical protein
MATDQSNLSAKEQMEGLRMGVEVAREQFQAAQTPVSPTQQPKENE